MQSSHIDKLYRIERRIKTLPDVEKQNIRQQESVPLIEQFKAWLNKASAQLLPQSALAKAVKYALNQWS